MKQITHILFAIIPIWLVKGINIVSERYQFYSLRSKKNKKK